MQKTIYRKIKATWHEKRVMPENATSGQRIKWHLAHQKHCGYQPIPDKLKTEMKKRGVKLGD